MMKKLQKLGIGLTILASLNLLVAGKVVADQQQVSMAVNSGLLGLHNIDPLTFNRTIVQPSTPAQTSVVLDPSSNDYNKKIAVIDQAVGDTFRVDVSLQNPEDDTNPTSPSVLPYTDFSMLTFTQNNTDSVDSGANNAPAGPNNVTALLDYKPTSGDYTDVVTNPDSINAANFTAFPIDSGDPDPADSGSESLPVTIMERTSVGTLPNIGTYSVGMVLRANLPIGTQAGNYQSQLTFTFTQHP